MFVELWGSAADGRMKSVLPSAALGWAGLLRRLSLLSNNWSFATAVVEAAGSGKRSSYE